VLDLELLEEVLARYDVANLWAAVGWFLERHRSEFHVPEPTLIRFQRQCRRSPQYVVRGQRGGTFVARWKLIVPTSLVLDASGHR
jgi:hypothetical protein